MNKLSVALLTGLVLVGCSSTSKQATLKTAEKQNVEYTFEVDQNYQAVYERILEQARACTKPQFTAKMTVHNQLLNDIKAADVSFALQGFFSTTHYTKIRIDAISDTRTRVHVANGLPRWDDLARAVKDWVEKNSNNCEKEDSNNTARSNS